MKLVIFNSFQQAMPKWYEFQKFALLYGFQSYEWLSMWYSTIGKSEKIKPFIVFIYDEDSYLVYKRVGNSRYKESGIYSIFLGFLGSVENLTIVRVASARLNVFLRA